MARDTGGAEFIELLGDAEAVGGGDRASPEPSAGTTWRRWLPAVILMSLFGTVALASGLGVYALTGGDPAAPESEQIPPAVPAIVIEGYSTPQPTPTGPVHSSSGELIERPSGRILGTVDGLYDIDISTYADRQIAYVMVDHAALLAGLEITPAPVPLRVGANRWLHEVVTTSVEDGGPDLQYRQRFARILEKWEEGETYGAYGDWEWLFTTSR